MIGLGRHVNGLFHMEKSPMVVKATRCNNTTTHLNPNSVSSEQL